MIHKYEVGLIYRRAMRELLERMTFEIPESRYKEIKGILSSTFLVDAPPGTINEINRVVQLTIKEDKTACG